MSNANQLRGCPAGRLRSPRNPAQWARLLPLALLCLCSCKSVTYDMRNLRQPIVLNNNPFLDTNAAPPCALADVDQYTATVSKAEVTASTSCGGVTTTTTQSSFANEAQINAFKKIGGRTDLLIRGLTLEADFLALNALVAMGEKISVQAEGKVTEIRRAQPASASLSSGGVNP